MVFVLPTGELWVNPPFADLLNHSNDVRICHTYNSETGALIIEAGKEYITGDQVYYICFISCIYVNVFGDRSFIYTSLHYLRFTSITVRSPIAALRDSMVSRF